MRDCLIGIEGGVDGDRDAADPVPGLENRLPILVMRGIRCERVVVLGGAEEKISRIPVVGYVLRSFVTPIFAGPPLERAEGALHDAVTFREFCRENPHPGGEKIRPLCAKREAKCSWALDARGAEVCAFCRDRLALWESLLVAPAVRAVPAG